MTVKAALIGNPNCGKSTLFNALTGGRAHTGNWPGVTVERREGSYRVSGEYISITDLPGIYSLSPYSPEEAIARGYITDDTPDVIINIIDATSIERSLYLTTELMETDIPIVAALNMTDAAEKKGIRISPERLSEALGIEVLPISAVKRRGMDTLAAAVLRAARSRRRGICMLSGRTGEYAGQILRLLGKKVQHSAYYASKLLEEGDVPDNGLGLSEGDRQRIKALRIEAADGLQDKDLETAVAAERYALISKCCAGAVKGPPICSPMPSDRADRLLTHPVLGMPIFIAVMALVFAVTFSDSLFGIPMPGALLRRAAEYCADIVLSCLKNLLLATGAARWLISLLIDGIGGGVASVICFLPQILTLFLCITIMESSGYMARAAFLTDGLLRRAGLSGKAFVPMLMGFGCSVPAVLACRTIENQKDRALAITLIPFMSCSAKLPIYGLFCAAFFAGSRGIVTVLIYAAGISAALVSAAVIKKRVLKNGDAAFIMELPPYHMPRPHDICVSLYEKAKHFLIKAGTIIALASAAVWIMQNFSFSFKMVDDASQSMLASIGRVLSPLFVPLGFGDNWQLPVALLAGIIAKEAVASTLGVLYGADVSSPDASLAGAAAVLSSGIISPAAGAAFMVFVLLAPPCSAALAVIYREMPSVKYFWAAVGFYVTAAYIAAFAVYTLGSAAAAFL